MPVRPFETVMAYIRRVAQRAASDRQLLDQFADGRDESAFASLVVRHGPLVWRVCQRALDHEQDAEDVFQATFMMLARKAVSIRKRESVGPWLYGVAYRLAMNAKRSAQRRRVHEKLARGQRQEDPVSAAGFRELQAMLDEEVQRLPAKYRLPFVLCCLEGKSQEEAVRELGWKRGTISARLTQAREQLKQRLTRRGVTLSAALCALALDSTARAAIAPAVVRSR